MLTLGCFSDLSPDSEFILSHDRFVGFPSIPQKHHNYEAQLVKMVPCKFLIHRYRLGESPYVLELKPFLRII